MNVDNQMKKPRSIKKIKRAAPAPSLTGQLMPSYESYRQVTMLIINRDIPEFDAGLLSEILLLELERGGRALDEPTYMAIMKVAACLKKQQSDEISSECQAREVVRKARAGK